MTHHISDAGLLERFSVDRNEDAFLELVNRHGPMVLKVCRRLLASEHDVEDVFQATFLTLASKARLIAWDNSVGAWLHAVAHRLALHARTRASRRGRRERPLAELSGKLSRNRSEKLAEEYHPRCSVMEEIERRDLRCLLDEALEQLPEKYRAPVVLCYLEGKTNEEAARQLGWPAGSISRQALPRSLHAEAETGGCGMGHLHRPGLYGASGSQGPAGSIGVYKPVCDGPRAASDDGASTPGRVERRLAEAPRADGSRGNLARGSRTSG